MYSAPKVRKPAPEFHGTAWTPEGFKDIKLSDYKGKWLVLFFYPLDFTFVCPTEICNFSDAYEKFLKENCELIGVSIDSKFSHKEWANKPRKEGGLAPCKLTLLSDVSHDISKAYGVEIDEGEDKGLAFRANFIIDPEGILRHISVNDLPVGRNIDETFRLVEAFQFAAKYGEVCPAKWKPGKATIAVGNDEKVKQFWENELTKNLDKEN